MLDRGGSAGRVVNLVMAQPRRLPRIHRKPDLPQDQLTGSTEVGKQLMRGAAGQIKR